MAHSKTAADSKTEDYWVSYFGEYGKMFVREIPRTIKAALLPDLKRTANSEKRDLQIKSSSVVPLGYGVTKDDSLIVEGIVKVSYVDKSEIRTAGRLFTAQFTSDGDLVDFDHRAAPVA